MAHVVILHSHPDTGAAGAVAACLGDMTAYTVEIVPGKLPLRIGPNVVPVVVWSGQTGGDEVIAAFVASLQHAPGRAVVYGAGISTLPPQIEQLTHAVVYQSADGDRDLAAVREAIRAVTPRPEAGQRSQTVNAVSQEASPASQLRVFAAGLLVGALLGAGGLTLSQNLRAAAEGVGEQIDAPSPNERGLSAAQAEPVQPAPQALPVAAPRTVVPSAPPRSAPAPTPAPPVNVAPAAPASETAEPSEPRTEPPASSETVAPEKPSPSQPGG